MNKSGHLENLNTCT